ncbi:phosphopentomutase [Nitratireductor sp. ZSWI3]|uniref:phosphopentomutase n=1 Tax=Nitratireductor sp. ZSWI3 TaxID=2966359 RepID=UPI00214F9BEB|nr:phosphopentomutase [Nitratireductor sp. ZSWI3]MCR4268298.1 phosphopentomutase [Nitratireductor sp. ZSWI3]
MARAFLFVLDSFGIGHAPDAAAFASRGADTYGHIAAACAEGRGDRAGLRQGPLHVPHMKALGLAHAAALSAGDDPARLPPATGFYGAASETSRGKDTPSGHWEIAGVPVPFDWGYFPETEPTFPKALTDAIIEKAALPGILGNCHASGTEIIARLGEEHIRTGKPICYTSADSVFQIAAHETHFGLDRLYELCRIVRGLVDPLNIGRVIARPFVGEHAAEFERTANRRDYAVPPPQPTLLDRVEASGGTVFGIGKIGDIFAHQGVSEVRKAAGNMALFEATLKAMKDARDGDLVFANFVDFDTLYGHRRDVAGYAAALEAFDRRLPDALALLREGDMLILTADHGCDPTWAGTDHTRERVPVVGAAPGLKPGSIGLRSTFADIGETVADHLDLPAGKAGVSFLRELAPDA